MNAKIPDELIEITLEDVMKDETVYVVPWAMYADAAGNLWLNGKYSFGYEPIGTESMQIIRKVDGFEVFLTGHARDYRWHKSNQQYYMGGTNPLPVIKLHK